MSNCDEIQLLKADYPVKMKVGQRKVFRIRQKPEICASDGKIHQTCLYSVVKI